MAHTQDRRAPVATVSFPLHEQLDIAATAIRAAIGTRRPSVGLVLGSGLGSYADRLTDAVGIDYGDIPRFPLSTVQGHAGRLVVGSAGGVTCAAMQGRVHFYEGQDMASVVFPLRTLVRLGCKTIIVTNAAGGVNAAFLPGDLVLISDHINLLPEHPLRGDNDDRLGPRFPDMSEAYAAELRALARVVARHQGLEAKEGVYCAMQGPSYETPAEIRMVRALGGDLVGMSTVPEVIVARHMGARVLGISCVTNLAAGISEKPLSHDEVTETAARVRDRFVALLDGILEAIGREQEKA
jgi:purine-nucleoside phosphorylase